MSFVVGSVTLPMIPYRAKESNPAELKTGTYPGTKPLIYSIGLKPLKLIVEGYIFVAGQTKAYLKTNYIDPLRAYRKTIVTISTPNSMYNGDYIMEDCEFTEAKEYPGAFHYKMLLTQGSEMAVFT